MLPQVDVIIWIVILAILFYAIISFFGVIFQNVVFQRYRLNRNEAALRKTRLHEQNEEKNRYRNSLLGEVKKDREA